jgi:predicted GIY-YIG superfamily endonuclease
MYDSGGNLLYVGITRNPAGRFSQHMTDKAWWRLVSDIHIERFTTREEALLAESVAIESEDPVFNLSRPNAQTKPGVTIRLFTCRYCHQQFIDELYPDSDPMDECQSCNEAICDAHAAGAQWGISYALTERANVR